MTERVFRKSPGITAREIDLSAPTAAGPQGVPAAVIGTSRRGPAFVPVTVSSFQDFELKFGKTDGEKFGPLALSEWMRNAQAGTYVRVLGTGDGKRKSESDGTVTNAGFVVGGQTPQENGNIGRNPYAGDGGELGRTYFLGCFMSESLGSTIFSEADIEHAKGTGAIPVLRGVIMTPSGVLAALSSSDTSATSVTASDRAWNSFVNGNDGGWPIGNLIEGADGTQQRFTMILNGHTWSPDNPNILTASFNPSDSKYISKVLNTDPLKIEERGHLLYAHFNIYSGTKPSTSYATPSITNLSEPHSGDGKMIAFLASGSLGRDTFDANSLIPNFENFRTRFQTAFSPFVTSQKFGNNNKNLFRVHSLDDGVSGNTKVKISLRNIRKAPAGNKYGRFDLLVRDFYDNDDSVVALETFNNLTLDLNDERFIGRVIGTQNTFYDFDRATGAQKLVVDGAYPNLSRYIRVELATPVKEGTINPSALPLGFRGPQHLVTSGSSIISNTTGSELATADTLQRIVQPPVPMRDLIGVGATNRLRENANLFWGVQFDRKDDLIEPNKNISRVVDDSIASFAKYYSSFHPTSRNFAVVNNEGVADTGGTILDADRFNNNAFSLENVEIITGSADTPVADEWKNARYRRDGILGTDRDTVRFLNVEKDFGVNSVQKRLKFTFFLMGGFDGVQIFDRDKSELGNNSVKREMDDATNQGGTAGPTVSAYRKALDVLSDRANADIQLLTLPGIRHPAVTDYAIDTVENRFDALLLLDLEERDTINVVVTSSIESDGSPIKISVGNTVADFKGRNLDSSFAAAYFPDVVMPDPTTLTNVRVPPTVAVLGAFALNDSLQHPWFAPAGFSRGALTSVLRTQVNLSADNMDDLYEADINPLVRFPGTTSPVVYGQKTLQAAQSALDRVNVRRLLIEIRRKVRSVADSLVFEPNRLTTLTKFTDKVNPILQTVQQQQGLDQFKVVVDSSTTTQADIENNTIRGKIFLRPTRTVEFISLDFVVTNPGA